MVKLAKVRPLKDVALSPKMYAFVIVMEAMVAHEAFTQ